jgi:hypothetical protein
LNIVLLRYFYKERKKRTTLATEPISQLPVTNSLTGSESVVLNQGGTTKTAPASAVAGLAPNALGNVLITMPASGQILVYNGTRWVNATPSVPVTPISDFIYNQPTPSYVWDITHNLNRYPSVTATDDTNEQIIGDITYLSMNELTITFSGLTSGSAYLV